LNIKNLSKGAELQSAVKRIIHGLNECVKEGMFIDANVIGAKLTRNSDCYISVKLTLRENDNIIDKHMAFSVVNNFIFPSIPLRALCDL
jgi:hypothetical protein